MRREKIYQGVIIFMLIGFTLFFVKSHNNFMDLLAVNDELTDLVDQQRTDNEAIVEQWKESYNDLQHKYGHLLVDYDQIEARLEETDIPVYNFTEAEIYLIAQCVEAEAGYYKYAPDSQRYVTQVILNRLHSSQFPDSVEEVIYQKTASGLPQFSVAYNGMMEEHYDVEPETLANVYSVIVHGTDLPEYVLYFSSAGVTENWINTLNVYTECDGTVFYYYSTED